MSSHIIMLAAENDALHGGKVGGIGDVVRDVPPVLARRGLRVTVLTPSYGALAELPGAVRLSALEVGFGGSSQHVELYRVPGKREVDGVEHWVLEHPLFAAGGPGKIYCDDPPQRPFATDASKFALFCLAAAELIAQQQSPLPDVIHLHDWHAALFLLLRRYHPAYRQLQTVRCVFTIHNLALQGIRPLGGDSSSLATWYPGLHCEHALVADPRWPDCLNPMAVGIRLADAVHTVSPSYANEILRSSAVEANGYYGGEGLEGDLLVAHEQQRLQGILNGCEYPDPPPVATPWPALLDLLREQVLRWVGEGSSVNSAQFIAHARLSKLTRRRPGLLLTSVGRITDQKMRLLQTRLADGRWALEALLEVLGKRGVLLLLGSGDTDYEQFLTTIAGRCSNLIFLRGYSDPLAQALYASGDLFLMPSSFEPCGISQMLAMRAGQPCLVHQVGGLKDTVQPGVNGFGFNGSSLSKQAQDMVDCLQAALALQSEQPQRWQALCEAARAARFSWEDSISAYLHQLYALPDAS